MTLWDSWLLSENKCLLLPSLALPRNRTCWSQFWPLDYNLLCSNREYSVFLCVLVSLWIWNFPLLMLNMPDEDAIKDYKTRMSWNLSKILPWAINLRCTSKRGVHVRIFESCDISLEKMPTSHPPHTHFTTTSHPLHNHLTTTSHAVSPALLENVQHCGGEPEQAATMATQEWTKLHGEIMSWIANV